MPEIVTLDLSQLDDFEKKILQKIKNVALPVAVKGTLNTLAFQTRRGSRDTIEKEFTQRNKFTKNSIRVAPTKTLKMSDMVATVGSVAPYMLAQEVGEKRSSKGEHGLRIPTGRAAGQKRLYPRTKVIQKKHRRGQITLTQSKISAKSKEQFLLMSIRVAGLRGQNPYIFLSFGNRKKIGLYKVIPRGAPPSTRYKRGKKSFPRKFKWGRPKGTPGKEKLVLIHSFAQRAINIPATGWLSENVEKVSVKKQEIFNAEADRAFNRFVK